MKRLAGRACQPFKPEDQMVTHLVFLALIVVIATVKVKIIIRQR
ncbi:hypothetical protein [Rhodopila sp.]|jgi:hypothetical protein|nr:hypothetical protein [Rhodopila sp.]HVZ08541.1 hypothetical protein [Rhodopila sp.]